MNTLLNENTKKAFVIDKTVLLLGEGKDELNFFSGLVRHTGLSTSVQVAQYGGKQKLAAFLSDLSAQTNFPSLHALGITCDADHDCAATLDSVRHAIQKATFPSSLRVEIFILPKANIAGALEALVLEAVSASPAWPCVERFMDCVTPRDDKPLSQTETDKRRLHVWLSTLSNPAMRLGEAALQKHIPFDHQAFQPVINFIQSLASATENRSAPHA